MEERGYLKQKWEGYSPEPKPDSRNAIAANLTVKKRRGMLFRFAAVFLGLAGFTGLFYSLYHIKNKSARVEVAKQTNAAGQTQIDNNATPSLHSDKRAENEQMSQSTDSVPIIDATSKNTSLAASFDNNTNTESVHINSRGGKSASNANPKRTARNNKQLSISKSKRVAHIPHTQQNEIAGAIISDMPTWAGNSVDAENVYADEDTFLMKGKMPELQTAMLETANSQSNVAKEQPKTFEPISWWQGTPIVYSVLGGIGYNVATTYINQPANEWRTIQLSRILNQARRLCFQAGMRAEKAITLRTWLYGMAAMQILRDELVYTVTRFQTNSFTTNESADGSTLLIPLGNTRELRTQMPLLLPQLELGVSIKELPLLDRIHLGGGVRSGIVENRFGETESKKTRFTQVFYYNISFERKLHIGKRTLRLETFFTGSQTPDWQVGGIIQRQYRCVGLRVHVPIN
jgi:hypothetical protein